MSERKIKLEEIFNDLDEGIKCDLDDWGKYCIIQRFREVAKQTLELAADMAALNYGEDEGQCTSIDKQSILDVINLIE